MKRIFLSGTLAAALLLPAGMTPALLAQKVDPNTISYTVLLGPVYPIEGESNQLTGQIHLDDSTGVLQQLDFSVPLQSFHGVNSGYLAWLGNGWYFPDLEFQSHKVEQSDKALRIPGTLRFRGHSTVLTLYASRSDDADTITLSGEFSLPVYDFFPFGPPPFALVPSAIPMEFKMTFDKPQPKPVAAPS